MTAQKRDWLRTFAEPAVLSDLFAAARDCMGQVCGHEPADCDCPENLMQPSEFAEWIQRETLMAQQGPTRFERGKRPYRRKADQLKLAIAG